ncbi:MAG: Gfo/Idh/MocA family oxidoreductase [Pseudomonadota bacterium]
MEKLGVGIIGAGNISKAYLRLAPLFRGLEILAIGDLDPDASKKRGEEFGIRACSVEELLAAPDIDVVVNLTIPAAHFSVTRNILEAGKHAYSEKPFVLSVEEGKELQKLASNRNLRVGSAPDTFLGGSHQQARELIDTGSIGKVTAGTCHVMSHGMEDWHPNPDFFFQPGAGPMLDLGPYYVSNLIQLIGPVTRVGALTTAATETRTIGSEPRRGEEIPVDTPTNIHSLLELASGATITFSASWDVWAHRHAPMELYGTEGSLFLPDPNFFGGKLERAGRDGKIGTVPTGDHPFAVPNEDHDGIMLANYRVAGLAEMVAAISEDRPHRCSMELALHTVDVMTGVLRSGEEGSFVDMTTSCERPAALGAKEAEELLAN